MKKRVLASLLVVAMLLSMVACSSKDEQSTGSKVETTIDEKGNEVVVATPTPTDVPVEEITDVDEISVLTNGELVHGKFETTRHITVETFDRDGKTAADDNMYTDYIKKGMLEKYNVEVEFVAVPRWTEVDQINNLLAAQNAPDICYTYSYPTIQQYANYGGVQDLQEWLTDEYKGLFSNLWNWLGSANIYYDQDPEDGTIWAIEGRRNNTYRINTFVRQDWLNKLGLEAPTTTAEFEAMLVAFRDNAELLLGDDADKMVPLSVSYDIGWRAANLIESKMDPNITDKELYINGYDDRKFTENGTKEAVRLLNKWYNDGLIWKDFALYPSGDATEDDMMKAGYVGAFMHNYDYPFRNGVDSINAILKATYGDDAAFVAINCFEDSEGNYTKYSYSAAGDRKAFFPATNDEPLASMLYLDFISSPEVVEYLQIGEEGITHTVLEDGAIQTMAADDDHVAYTMNSGNNIDLTMTCNGLRLSSTELTEKSLAYGYAENDPEIVAAAMAAASLDAREPKNVNVGEIAAEAEVGSGLSDLRDAAFDKAVVCSVEDFDKVWDEGMAEYLAAGGQEIIDERTAAWEANYGTATMLP